MQKQCERCGKAIELKPDPDCPTKWAESLAALVHFCQRCADYGWRRVQLHERIVQEAVSLRNTRSKPSPTDKDKRIMDKSIGSIKSLCQTFGQRCCEFYRVQYQPDESLIEAIIEKPQDALSLLNRYERGVRGISGHTQP